MAGDRIFCQFLAILLTFIGVTSAGQKAIPIHLTEETWDKMLQGEWLVKFHAPWCPACKALSSTWQGVASWSDDLGISVAEIDVTENPGLSGRFLVTSLPTIYHVKDGEFRTYGGSRTEDEIVSFVDDKKWEQIEPISWWTSPKSGHMAAMQWFFKISILIRELHNAMTEQYGIPTWASYAIFAISTIAVGLLFGIILVFCCDYCWPPRPPPMSYKVGQEGDHLHEEHEDSRDEDNIEDDMPDAGDTNNVRRRGPTQPPAD